MFLQVSLAAKLKGMGWFMWEEKHQLVGKRLQDILEFLKWNFNSNLHLDRSLSRSVFQDQLIQGCFILTLDQMAFSKPLSWNANNNLCLDLLVCIYKLFSFTLFPVKRLYCIEMKMMLKSSWWLNVVCLLIAHAVVLFVFFNTRVYNKRFLVNSCVICWDVLESVVTQAV